MPVQSQREKIDLKAEYPCPCRRKGRLTPIALTDAFGCDRCHQIFVVQDNGYIIEQLSTNYPYKRTWRWTGHQWTVSRGGLGRDYLPLLLVSIFVFGFLISLTILQSPLSANVTFRVAATILVPSVMLGLMLWLACRR
jgi:hypothetical protein